MQFCLGGTAFFVFRDDRLGCSPNGKASISGSFGGGVATCFVILPSLVHDGHGLLKQFHGLGIWTISLGVKFLKVAHVAGDAIPVGGRWNGDPCEV
jgi:hypothetical protein